MRTSSAVLVGDVGGTHARFAIVEPHLFRVEARAELPADEYQTFDAALSAYLSGLGIAQRPQAAAIGVAGPVTNGEVDFTNRDWRASEADLRRLGFERALLINDFAAVAFSITALGTEDVRTLGPEVEGLAGDPITVLGAGTGFGVACLAQFRGLSLPIATEGGHISFAPQTDDEMEVARILARRFGHVSVERVLSGPGLENLHSALCELSGEVEQLAAADIVRHAEAGAETCKAALDMFCAIFGSVAGDLALAHGARGGVYIAGGIATKIEKHLLASSFRERFESKGRLGNYVKAIPTRLVLHEDAALLGAALASAKFGAG